MIKNSVTSFGCPSLLVKNSNVSFCKTLGGLRSLTRVKVFCDLTVNFGEIQHFTRPGTFGTGYTSTHTQVNLQKTNYTAPLLSCRVRRSARSFEQLLHLILISTSFIHQKSGFAKFTRKRQTTRNLDSPNLPGIQNRQIHQKSRIAKYNPESPNLPELLNQ